MRGETTDQEARGPVGHRAATDQQALERILRFVDFLKAYDAQKNPPVTDISTYRLFAVDAQSLPAVPGIELTAGADDWLTVRFVDLPAKPQIPKEMSAYLPSAAQITAAVAPEPVVPEADTEPDPVDPDAPHRPTAQGAQRLAQVNQWVSEQWEPWSLQWHEAQQGKEFYRNLFEQQELIEGDRETYELVWGFGRARWTPGSGLNLRHPLFTTVVEVATGEDKALAIRPVEPLQLETLPFANFELTDRAGLAAQRDSVAEEPFDPWTTDVLAERVRKAVRALSHHGVVAGEAAEQPGAPVSDTGWVLYARRRRPDRQGFLDAMRDLYSSDVLPPDALSSVVVDAPSVYEVSDEPEIGSELIGGEPVDDRHSTPEEELLLPLPSNEEQQLILRKAQRQSGVVVQGPPGTGKSHTIANLISHYVAYGHRVLVVAEKEQALSVLAEKIPAEIRDLTVSVLGSDQASRQALEASITSIQAHVAGMDRRTEDNRIAILTSDLKDLDAHIAETTDRLMAARRAETETLTGNWPVTPATPERVASWVSGHEADLGYITDEIPPARLCPLEAGELAEMVRLLNDIGLERARQTAYVLPQLLELPTGAELAVLLGRRDQLRAALATAAPEVSDWAPIDAATTEQLEQLTDRLTKELDSAGAAEESWLATIAAQLADPLLAQDWNQFLAAMRSDREQLLSLRPQLTAHQVQVPDRSDPSFAPALEQARVKLAERGKLGMFAGGAKRVLEECRVDGAIPASAESVALCQVALRVGDLRTALRTRWANQISPFGGPDLPAERPEDIAGQYIEQIGAVATAPERWSQLSTDLHEIGVRPVGIYGPKAIRRLIDIMSAAAARGREREIAAQLVDLAATLTEGAQHDNASPLWQLLSDALRSETTQTWQQYRDAVSDLVEISSSALRLTTLISELRQAAPAWTEAILCDPPQAHDPATLTQAWTWRQPETWVRQVMTGDSPQDLQRQLENLTSQRQRLVTELVGARAWRRLADNLGDRQRQALNGYLAAVKRYGKTGGKFAARWLAAIREALNDSKDAVPVWIMTTSRALTSFRPAKEVPFDVVIVDEASQIGIDVIPLLALAKRAIVVGDDKQTSPAAVGVDQQKVFELIDSHLPDVPGQKVLFNPGNSLYDVAKQKFPSQIMLREHFRSLPEIISFSNGMFYENRIEHLRENRPAPGWPALGAVKVIDGYRTRGTDVNEPEASVVAELIAKMVDDPQYDGMDFGVICLLSGGQSDLVRKKLFDRVGPVVITQRRVRVGDSATFQGDERDIIVVSTVVATDPSNPTGRIGAMTNEGDAQRINVAASRARNRMIVVHSLDPERLPNNDLRAALIRHCRNPMQTMPSLEDALSRCDSEFERRVLRRIVTQGYTRVRSQVRVGTTNHSYRIDLVVDGPNSRLAIECDGERWHGPERWQADRARQEVLERAGWKFCRIRGSAYFRDPEAALQPLWERLEELGIPAGDAWLAGTGTLADTVFEVRGLDPSIEGVYDTPEVTRLPGMPPEPTPTPRIAPPTNSAAASAPRHGLGPQRGLALESDLPTVVEAEQPSPLPVSAISTSNQVEEELQATLLSNQAAEDHEPAEELGKSSIKQVSAPQTPATDRPVRLEPYVSFSGHSFAPVAESNQSAVARGLHDVVTVEGPILALRAYQQYVRASGGQRVGSDMKRILNRVLHAEIRAGRIACLGDDTQGMIGKTLYLPGAEMVVVRELGPRTLFEVPRSELQALLRLLGLGNMPPSEGLFRTVLDTYGLVRLTSTTADYIRAAQSYTYTT